MPIKLFFLWILTLIGLGKGAIALLCPGMAISLLFRHTISAINVWAYSIGVSISFWLVILWWQLLLPISLHVCYVLAVTFTAIAVLIAVFKKGWFQINIKNQFSSNAIHGVVLLALLYGLRAGPLLNKIVPPGVNDMSLHTFMAMLIKDTGGLPLSLTPYFPIHSFPQGPWGFSAFNAVIAYAGDMSVEYAAKILTAFSHFFVGVAFSIIMPDSVPSSVRIAVGGIVSLISFSPQSMVGWGGNPTVLSFVFVILIASLFRPPNVFPVSLTRWGIVSLYAASAFLIQPIPLLAFAYIAMPPLFYALWKRLIKPVTLLYLSASLLLTVILLLPFWVHLPQSSSSQLKLWIWGWQTFQLKLPFHLFNKGINLLASDNIFGGIIVFVFAHLGFAAFALWKKGSPDWWYVVGVIVLILNVYVWWLPFSYLLYPERVVILALIAVPGVLASCWQGLKNNRIRWLVGVLLVCIALGSWWNQYAKPIQERSAVTSNDMLIFNWMKEHIPKGTRIGNNFSDAGAWTPVLTGFPVTYPHINPVIGSYLPHGLPIGASDYYFIGEKGVYKGGLTINESSLKSRSCVVVYQKGGAKLYYCGKRS